MDSSQQASFVILREEFKRRRQEGQESENQRQGFAQPPTIPCTIKSGFTPPVGKNRHGDRNERYETVLGSSQYHPDESRQDVDTQFEDCGKTHNRSLN